jgi:hypothetical protein
MEGAGDRTSATTPALYSTVKIKKGFNIQLAKTKGGGKKEVRTDKGDVRAERA